MRRDELMRFKFHNKDIFIILLEELRAIGYVFRAYTSRYEKPYTHEYSSKILEQLQEYHEHYDTVVVIKKEERLFFGSSYKMVDPYSFRSLYTNNNECYDFTAIFTKEVRNILIDNLKLIKNERDN